MFRILILMVITCPDANRDGARHDESNFRHTRFSVFIIIIQLCVKIFIMARFISLSFLYSAY